MKIEKFHLETQDGHKATGRAYGAKFHKGPIHLSAVSSMIKLKSPKSDGGKHGQDHHHHHRNEAKDSNHLDNYRVSEPSDEDDDERELGSGKNYAKSLDTFR